MRFAIEGCLSFLHRFEESCLGLGWSPVDLISQQHVGKNRATPEVELATLEIIHVGPGNIRRQEVGSKLYPGKIAAHAHSKASRQQRLRKSWIVFEENVRICQNRKHHLLENRFFSNDDLLDLVYDLMAFRACLIHLQFFQPSIRSMIRRSN